jgi:hypothetical protein
MRRFRSRGLVHQVKRVWNIDGVNLGFETLSDTYLRLIRPLNLRGACGEQALWITGYVDVTSTKDPLTCLTCLVSTS